MDDPYPGPGPECHERQRSMLVFWKEQARKKVESRDGIKGALLGSRLLDSIWDDVDVIRLARALLHIYKDGRSLKTDLFANLMHEISGAEALSQGWAAGGAAFTERILNQRVYPFPLKIPK